MDNEITLETGADELKLLEFYIGDESFGINIAKVSEILRMPPITPMPSAPDGIEGVFMHRDKLVTVIDLHKILNLNIKNDIGNGMIIVCDFEKLSIAFHVSTVMGIRNLNWSVIENPPSMQSGAGEGITTGIAKYEDRIIMMLDFEKIVCDLSYGNEITGSPAEISAPAAEIDYSRCIIVAEDSPFLKKMVVEALTKVGFNNIAAFNNGLEAWNYIKSKKGTGKIKQAVAAVISDIEMPQMDGHSLTKHIKGDKELNHVPVYLFSSLIHENMRMRGDSAGADAQFARSELNELLKTLIEEFAKK